jgi:hypothetical protein
MRAEADCPLFYFDGAGPGSSRPTRSLWEAAARDIQEGSIMASIAASVGRVDRKRSCYNRWIDRETIRLLLNTIPKRDGGASFSLAPEMVPPGLISDKLYHAILDFQTFHSGSPYHLFVDGHIDPHGKGIEKLNWSGKLATTFIPPTVFVAPVTASGTLTKVRNNATNVLSVSLPGGFDIDFTLTAGSPGAQVTIQIEAEGVLSDSGKTFLDLGTGLLTRHYTCRENAISARVRSRVNLNARSAASSFSVDFVITLV